MNQHTILFILLLVFCNTLEGNAQTQFLEPNLKPGKYQVGFKSFHEYDYSRSVPDSHSIFLKTRLKNLARPIQICVWYPAAVKKSAIPMPCKEYIHLMATEFDFDYQGDPMKHPFVKERMSDFNKQQADALMKATSGAYKNAPQEKGGFPVILYAPGGFGSSFENAALFEYLASHGFIVVSYPSTPIEEAGFVDNSKWPLLFESRARDLQFVLAFMCAFPNADMNNFGLMGFSLGGTSITSVASRDIRVKAVISLDGWHEKDILKWLPFTDYKKVNVPFINLVNKDKTLENPNCIIYDSIGHKDAYYVRFNKFGHIFFGSSWILLTDHNSADENAVGGTQEEVNLGYNLLSNYVLYFFNAYLRNDLNSLKGLKTLHQRSDIPPDFLNFEMKQK